MLCRLLISILMLLPLSAVEKISYNRDIRPILSENCFFCHGFDQNKREADLRLDTFEGAIADGAIVPGEPSKSLIIERIFSKDEDEHMPPLDSAYRLTKKQKETLTEWIRQGAEYDEHWAFKKLVRPDVPALSAHPIDAFLKRTWEEQKVVPVEKADPRSLLRRLSYDLRGLPPTAEEVSAFEKDPSDSHYQQFVQKWITSLEYAEHQGLLWLDLVRHADSNGMVSDERIATGPFRKYVIDSFQKNMPFDQFTREQLAGDLLPDRDDRTLTASAYNRLVKTNCEAGVIEKEALYAIKGEHVRAVGTVWLGLTTGCAECHDHKYDPILAKDYYSLAAFFDPLIEAGVYEPGDRRVPLHYLYDDQGKSKRENQLAAEIDEVRKKLYSGKIDSAAFEEFKTSLVSQEKAAKAQKELVDWNWFPAQLEAAHLMKGEYEQTPEGRLTTANPDEFHQHLSGETLRTKLSGKNEGYFTHVTLDVNDAPEVVALQVIHGAYRRIGWHKDYFLTYYWGPKDHPEIKKRFQQKLVHMGPLPESGAKVRLEIPKKKIQKAKFTPQAMAWMHFGGKVTWGDSGYRTTAHQAFINETAASSYRYYWELPLNRDDRGGFPALTSKSIKMAPEKRRKVHQDIADMAFYESQKPELVSKLSKLYRDVYRLRQDGWETLVSKVGPTKETRVLNRGNFMDETGPIATPAIPEIFGKLKNPNPTRLDLANWITSKDNPLTARVFVNRLWHQFYGRGISETLEDSGNQGDWPSHLNLLDWLASEFQREWDIRKMVQLMVSSDSYKLSSIPGSLLAQKDPTNRLHARQSRSRHTAEEIRDSALFAAGLLELTKEIPNESFYPYHPENYWQMSHKVHFGSRYQLWETSQGAEQYQRSLYTYWKRQNIHPSMLAFDAPTRQECTAKRTITNTPAQALALLNDPQFVEAARVLASRVMTQKEHRIEHLFQLVLQRDPSAEEAVAVKKLYQKMLARFRENPKEAQEFLEVGQHPTQAKDKAEHAAWAATCRTILNLHEFITRS